MREEKGAINKNLFGWLLGLLLIDRLTKSFFLGNSRTIINQGVSWGIASTFSPALLTLLSLLILAGGCLFLFSYPNKFGLWLISLGGFSNLVDRLWFGGVVDFISLPLLPAFNLADVTICLGGFFLLVDFLKTQTIS
jgi:signal peptidase II